MGVQPHMNSHIGTCTHVYAIVRLWSSYLMVDDGNYIPYYVVSSDLSMSSKPLRSVDLEKNTYKFCLIYIRT